MECSPSGPSRRSLKRLRNPGSGGPSGLLALSELHDDTITDNIRSQKRYLSEVMASDMSRLNMALEPHAANCRAEPSCESFPPDSMQTDTPVCSPSHSGRSDFSAACSIVSQEAEASSHGTASAPRTTTVLRSPRQKARQRSSPLKAGLPFPRSPSYSTPSRGHHLGRMASALDAKERMPPSPSDSHMAMDLRRAALLRSVLSRKESSALASVSTNDSGPAIGPPLPRLTEWEEVSGEAVMPELLRSSLHSCDAPPGSVDSNLGSAFMELGFTATPTRSKLASSSSFRQTGTRQNDVFEQEEAVQTAHVDQEEQAAAKHKRRRSLLSSCN